MNAQIKELLRPEILNTVDGLELIARIVVEGFMSGSNRSQSVGAGQEFTQYRSYEPGDDLRQLDWKMFARSERYFIKQSDIDTNITVKFILDASNSMGYAEDGITKLQYARVVTAALAYLARKQSDAFGLYTVNEKRITAIQPRFEHAQFMRFLNELIRVKSEGAWNRSTELEHLHGSPGKDLIIFLTDLYDESNDLYQFVSGLKTNRNEVIVIHLMGKHELDFDFDGSFTFEDLESGERLKIDSRLQQAEYVSRVQDWIKDSRDRLLEKRIDYLQIRMDEGVEKTLRTFLSVRKRMAR
ncbi:MAG: DUF58 domain-containing protein [Cyclobacteriaceae bacterium]|nr:DUF58 domain-containing protein [Cyclobacteriaceae bacterium]